MGCRRSLQLGQMHGNIKSNFCELRSFIDGFFLLLVGSIGVLHLLFEQLTSGSSDLIHIQMGRLRYCNHAKKRRNKKLIGKLDRVSRA